MNYYNLLGITENATTDQIKYAYKKSINEANDQDTLNKLSKAYLVLSDDNKRKTYDEYLRNNSVMLNDTFSGNNLMSYMMNKMNQMHKEMTHLYNRFQDESLHAFDSNTNMTDRQNTRYYTQHYESMFYTDDNGMRKGKTIKKINNNGKAFHQESVLDNGTWKTTKFYPDGQSKEYINIDYPKNKRYHDKPNKYRLSKN